MSRTAALFGMGSIVITSGVIACASTSDKDTAPAGLNARGPSSPTSDAAVTDPSFDASSEETGASTGTTPVPLPALPLNTDGRWILDAKGKRFKLASISWYGMEEKDHVVAGLDKQPLATIAKSIRTMGFNSVRIPWSNEMFEQNPVIMDSALTMNLTLQGKHALEVLDAIIDALAQEGIVVVLTNHVSRADWCCTETDGQGLWHTAEYPETKWLADWRAIVKRYVSRPSVVAAELRNELRKANGQAPVWGGGDPDLDWHAAAERGGNAVLAENPSLLIVVDGLSYATDLTGVYTLPIALSVPKRLVYAAHDYSFFHTTIANYTDLKTKLGNDWGYILVQGKAYTAPIWVSEFGTCNTSANCVADATGQGFWFQSIKRYLTEADIDWGYWPLNGTEANGRGRTFGATETYGVLDATWSKASLPSLTDQLKALAPATQFP